MIVTRDLRLKCINAGLSIPAVEGTISNQLQEEGRETMQEGDLHDMYDMVSWRLVKTLPFTEGYIYGLNQLSDLGQFPETPLPL